MKTPQDPKGKPKAKRTLGAGATSKRAAGARKTATTGTKDKRAASATRKGGKAAVGEPATESTASLRIDERIRDLGGWRGETLARMRALILEADPGMTEEWKWNNPVWSHHGIVSTGEAYKQVVKLTFARGASVPDPSHLFNSSLEGNTRRAIDIREGEKVDARAFKTLVQAAVARNGTAAKKSGSIRDEKAKPAKLLSGGNPQIAKADGDAPVQAYIAALPGWVP